MYPVIKTGAAGSWRIWNVVTIRDKKVTRFPFYL